MPYKNEHSARQLAPNQFESFDRRPLDNGIELIVGKLATSGKMAVQSVRAQSDRVSLPQFRDWLNAHGYRVDKIVSAKKLSYMRSPAYEPVQLGEIREYAAPDGLTVGTPFKTLSCGPISSRMTGEQIGEITPELLKELVRVYQIRRNIDPVIIDWCHASSDDQAPIDNTVSLGEIIDMYISNDALWVVPAYSDRGVQIVEGTNPLWSSPEFLQGSVYDRNDGSLIGDGQILAVSLTPRPQQTADKLTKIKLLEDLNMENENMTGAAGDASELEALRAEKEALESMVEQLRSEIESLRSSQMAEGEDAEDDEKAESMEEEIEEEDDKKTEIKLSEHVLLREQQYQIQKLSEQLATIRRERADDQRRTTIQRLCEQGKITPAEVPNAERLYNLDRKLFGEMFESRPMQSAVNLSEYGHGYGSPETVTRASIDTEVKKLSEAQGIDYASALDQYRRDNRDQYLSAMRRAQ